MGMLKHQSEETAEYISIGAKQTPIQEDLNGEFRTNLLVGSPRQSRANTDRFQHNEIASSSRGAHNNRGSRHTFFEPNVMGSSPGDRT